MKSLEATLKEVVETLRKSDCRFAVAGGVVANIYRKDIRTTLDVDFLFYTEKDVDKSAEDVLKTLGLAVGMVKEHQLNRTPAMNKKSQPNLIAIGRRTEAKNELGVDLLLPSFPWFKSALDRAEKNILDYGFAKVPSVTVEDMILIKLSAGRSKDLDDLESIFSAEHKLDLDYIESEMKRLKLKVPKSIKSFAPKQLRKIN